jgi:hypothetical protein
VICPELQSASGQLSDHRFHDIATLALHAIARKIEREPALLAVPRRNLQRWRSRFVKDPPRWWKEWEGILARPWSEIAAVLLDPAESATRLRQSSPFAGVLRPEERKAIHDALRP